MPNLDDVLQPFNNLGGNLIPTNTLNGLINTGSSLNGHITLGGAGTDNYNDLTNKPQINGVTLQGNKTTSDLGLFSGNYNDLTNTPTIPSRLSDLDVTYYNLQSGDTLRYIGEPVNGWENAPFPNALHNLSDVDVTSPVGGHALIFDSQSQKWVDRPYPYYNLTSKPTLNNVTISGDKTSLDYGLFSGNYNDLTNKPSLANVATSGSYDDLIDKPNYNQVINLGYNTSDKVINTNTLADILNNASQVTTDAGTFTYMIIFSAAWDIPQGNFYTAINVDGTNNNSTTTYAAPQSNSMCIFFGEITLTAGEHTINVRGRVSGSAGKAVTIPSYASVTVLLLRK